MAEKNASPAVFDTRNAASYDDRWAKLAPTREALHLLIRVLFSDLPADAHILCVGVGTGAELLDLAQAFPQARFTAVEPAAAMLAVCRQRAQTAGIAGRCTFHEGYLDSLSSSPAFDAATSLVVSHFITDKTARRDYFHQIALRLRPHGLLVASDLAGDGEMADYQKRLASWRQMLQYIEIPQVEIDKMLNTFGREVAILPPPEVAEIIASGGFDNPVLFFQSLLMHAWYARRIRQR